MTRNVWEETVTAALVGPDRAGDVPGGALAVVLGQEAPTPSRSGAAGDVSAPDPGGTTAAGPVDPAEALLTRIAVVSRWRRAGLDPPEGAVAAPPTCPPDARRVVVAGRGLLPVMLAQRDTGLVEQWAARVESRGGRPHPADLPALLDLATRPGVQRLQPVVERLAGPRAAWLAAQHSPWGWAAVAEEHAWRVAPRHARVGLLRRLRREGRRQRAAELLAETWDREGAEDRAALLGGLEEGLGPDDAAFLQAALDDGRAEARRSAARLLLALPDSPFAVAVGEAARGLVEQHGRRLRLRAHAHVDERLLDLLRDPTGGPAVDAAAVIAAAPLSTWTAEAGDVERTIHAAGDATEPGADLLLGAWSTAADREQDPVWTATLIAAAATGVRFPTPPPDPLDTATRGQLGRRLVRAPGGWGLDVVAAWPGPWDDVLSVTAAEALLRRAELAGATTELAAAVGARLAPAVATRLAGLPYDRRPLLRTLHRTLDLRAALDRELPP